MMHKSLKLTSVCVCVCVSAACYYLKESVPLLVLYFAVAKKQLHRLIRVTQ